ncbi:LIM and SH3 domain protein Lasp [Bacillus rossius redtenbacheri]|uniref:LIM and SH3 domain protein Lasp n=1 Tax=Bacillus rossius redtenbacheri TaxID=93214 RepID=UPI002FDE16E6
MNKKCSRCEKTVYPIEELKCLDKIWHKQCFKCQVCNMTLNMRNYKGFNKQPYCEAHIPKAKATTMAETPELKRIAENTKIQSNVKYHAEFEKAKGKFTQVVDDPELLRIKQNTRIISNVAYHGDLEKKAAMEQKRGTTSDNENSNGNLPVMPPPPPQQAPVQPEPPTNHHQHQHHPVQKHQAALGPGKIADYDPLTDGPRNSPYSARQSSTVIYTSDRGPVTSPPSRRVGSIADLDPVNDFYGSLASDGRPNNQHHAHAHAPPKQPAGKVFKAMYDYDAQDSDEVSFLDGDVIVNCTPIDEGWMTGLVQRTGQTGMLPANYVEPVN